MGKVTLKITPNWVSVINGLTLQLKSHLTKYFTVKFPSYWFSPRYKRGLWNGDTKFYWFKNDIFGVATGLLDKLVREIKKQGYEVEGNDSYRLNGEIPFEDIKLKGIELRDDQIQCLYDMRRKGRGIVQAVTGYGKGECMIAFSKWYFENHPYKSNKVLFLTHRKTIFEQVFEERIEKRLPEFDPMPMPKNNWLKGFVNIDNVNIIYIAMAQSMSKHILEREFEFFQTNTDIVFCDEVHRPETYERKVGNKKVHILSLMKNCYHRFGMSATPFKVEDGKNQKYHEFQTLSNFGSIITVDYESKINANITMIPITYEERSRDFPHALEQSRNSEDKARWIKKIIQDNPKRKIMVFVQHIEHGQILSAYLGLPFLYGETKSKERKDTCREFVEGKYKAIIVSSIFHFGVDIPEIDLIILAYIGKSYISVIQSIGRGLRMSKGKQELLVYDFYERDSSYLQDHSNERLKHYEMKGFEVNK